VSVGTRLHGLFRSKWLEWPKPTIERKRELCLIFKAFAREWMVLPDRIELSTSPLPMECSTAGLTPVQDIGMTFIFRVTEPIRELPNEADFSDQRLSYGNGLQ
jgi:hypothetical protein